MALAKATFNSLVKSKDGKSADTEKLILEVNFNPKELTLERDSDYGEADNTSDASELNFNGSDNLTLGMTLYFDTFELGTSVRTAYMTKLESLMRVGVDPPQPPAPTPSSTTPTPPPPPVGSPPTVLFVWGKFRFKGVIQSLSQTYTMFLSDGTPVRAQADISMQQTELSAADMAQEDPLSGPDTQAPTAQQIKEQGAAALAAKNASAAVDDPMSILGAQKSALTATPTMSARLSSFMGTSGESMIASGAVGAVIDGPKGAFDGVLTSAGNTQAFGTSTLGSAADTLASGQELNVASIAGGVTDSNLGSLGGGLNLGIQRDGSKLSFGASDGGGLSTSSGTPIFGAAGDQTVSSRGRFASDSGVGIGVGGAGTSGNAGSYSDGMTPANILPTGHGYGGTTSAGSTPASTGSTGTTAGTGAGAGHRPGAADTATGSGTTIHAGDGSGVGGASTAGSSGTGSGLKPIAPPPSTAPSGSGGNAATTGSSSGTAAAAATGSGSSTASAATSGSGVGGSSVAGSVTSGTGTGSKVSPSQATTPAATSPNDADSVVSNNGTEPPGHGSGKRGGG